MSQHTVLFDVQALMDQGVVRNVGHCKNRGRYALTAEHVPDDRPTAEQILAKMRSRARARAWGKEVRS